MSPKIILTVLFFVFVCIFSLGVCKIAKVQWVPGASKLPKIAPDRQEREGTLAKVKGNINT